MLVLLIGVNVVFDQKKLEASMQLLKSGDSTAFEYIYEQTNRMVYYLIFSIVKDHGKSEDIMQNVYINVFEKKNLYVSDVSVKAWIMTIARNLALNEYNRKKEIITEGAQLEFLANQKQKPTEETPLIDAAREHLEEEEFFIVMLCVGEGYTRKEVAKLIGLSTSGVTWKLNEALSKLKIIVERSRENEK